MKIKSLAIALTLALLCSLFAFGIPVSARTVSQANENAGFFEFTLYFSNFNWVDQLNWYSPDWTGGEVEFNGKIVPGHVGRFSGIMQADIHGYFGIGHGTYYTSTTTNFVTGKSSS